MKNPPFTAHPVSILYMLPKPRFDTTQHLFHPHPFAHVAPRVAVTMVNPAQQQRIHHCRAVLREVSYSLPFNLCPFPSLTRYPKHPYPRDRSWFLIPLRMAWFLGIGRHITLPPNENTPEPVASPRKASASPSASVADSVGTTKTTRSTRAKARGGKKTAAAELEEIGREASS